MKVGGRRARRRGHQGQKWEFEGWYGEAWIRVKREWVESEGGLVVTEGGLIVEKVGNGEVSLEVTFLRKSERRSKKQTKASSLAMRKDIEVGKA